MFEKLPRVSEIIWGQRKTLAPLSGKSRRQIIHKFGDLKGTLGRINGPKISEIVGPDFV